MYYIESSTTLLHVFGVGSLLTPEQYTHVSSTPVNRVLKILVILKDHTREGPENILQFIT